VVVALSGLLLLLDDGPRRADQHASYTMKPRSARDEPRCHPVRHHRRNDSSTSHERSFHHLSKSLMPKSSSATVGSAMDSLRRAPSFPPLASYAKPDGYGSADLYLSMPEFVVSAWLYKSSGAFLQIRRAG